MSNNNKIKWSDYKGYAEFIVSEGHHAFKVGNHKYGDSVIEHLRSLLVRVSTDRRYAVPYIEMCIGELEETKKRYPV